MRDEVAIGIARLLGLELAACGFVAQARLDAWVAAIPSYGRRRRRRGGCRRWRRWGRGLARRLARCMGHGACCRRLASAALGARKLEILGTTCSYGGKVDLDRLFRVMTSQNCVLAIVSMFNFKSRARHQEMILTDGGAPPPLPLVFSVNLES